MENVVFDIGKAMVQQFCERTRSRFCTFPHAAALLQRTSALCQIAAVPAAADKRLVGKIQLVNRLVYGSMKKICKGQFFGLGFVIHVFPPVILVSTEKKKPTSLTTISWYKVGFLTVCMSYCSRMSMHFRMRSLMSEVSSPLAF